MVISRGQVVDADLDHAEMASDEQIAESEAVLKREPADVAPDGMTIESFDIAPIPLYNEDVRQQGFPAPVDDLRARIKAADGLLIATPEYTIRFLAC